MTLASEGTVALSRQGKTDKSLPRGNHLALYPVTRWRRRASTILAISATVVPSLLMAAPVHASEEHPPIVPPAVQVTTSIDPGRSYNQPQMLVNPKHPDTLAIVGANYNAGTCGAFVSFDAGRLWREGQGVAKPSEYKTCVRSDYGPYLGAAYGTDGTIFVASAADNLGGQQDVNNLYLSRSHDFGDTWQTTIAHKGGTTVNFTAVDGSKVVGGEHYSLIRMAVDPSDSRYVYIGARLGIADRSPPHGLFGNVAIRNVIATSSDGGKTFRPPVDVMATVPRSEIAGAYVPSITVGSDGTVYSFTRERTPPKDPAHPFSPGMPAGSPGAGGRLLMSTSSDHGTTWKTKSIDNSAVACAGGCQSNPEAKIDPKTGDLYVVFGQSESADSESNILLMHSADKGRTWSKPIKVNDDNSRLDHLLPGLSIAPNGRVDVAWHDFRDDLAYQPADTTANETYWDVWYSYSTDGGRTWAKNIRVSDRSMNKNAGYTFNDQYGLGGPAGVASTNDASYFAWADSRAGSIAAPIEDYYFTSALFGIPTQAQTSSGGGHGIRDFILGVVAVVLIAGVVLLIGSVWMTRRHRVVRLRS